MLWSLFWCGKETNWMNLYPFVAHDAYFIHHRSGQMHQHDKGMYSLYACKVKLIVMFCLHASSHYCDSCCYVQTNSFTSDCQSFLPSFCPKRLLLTANPVLSTCRYITRGQWEHLWCLMWHNPKHLRQCRCGRRMLITSCSCPMASISQLCFLLIR